MAECGKSLVTEWLWPRVKCHLDYWWCFGGNVQGLSDEIALLQREKRNMDQKIEVARSLRAERPTTVVQGWFEVSGQKLEEAARIFQRCDGLKAWNIISRYSWGKRAKKTAERIARLRNATNAIRISDPPPPPARAPIPYKPTMEFESRKRVEEDIMEFRWAPTPYKPTMEFESRKRVEEDIMEFLRDDRTCMIAICGAGGVGKTTMVRRIGDRVHKILFDEVVHVVVSQQIDMFKIQTEIAELLGLKFSEDTLTARAHRLHRRLQDSNRKLIIFDDVWESFRLEDIGVPFEHGFTKCKIILTSRITDACSKMRAKIIRMELLNEEEAWALFKEKAGSYVEDPDLRPIAEDVVAECKGLPVALVTVGVALKDRSIRVWMNYLSQLRRSMPIHFPDYIKDVYKPLKLSYDFLEDGSAKSFFLLCCLFPEDYDIPIEHLTLYGIGLHMFERFRNIEEGRNRTYYLVQKLKSHFLLLDGDRRHSVKMHGVVRDVAIFIGSKEKDGFLMNSLEAFSMDSSSKDSSRNCNWMSIDISTENAKLPVLGSDFPNLRFMMIQDSTFNYFEFMSGGVPNKAVDGNNVICFEGMQGLKVLSISNVHFRSLPSTMELLKELRTLRLENCFVKDISVLGELVRLEILCIRRCHNIKELPTDIGKLNFLRLLELNLCARLKRIVAGIISSLVRLEELKIIDCFDKWEAKGNQSEKMNAGLSELESLPNLTSLEIDISDCNLLAAEICLSQKLVRYRIRSGPLYLSKEYERGIGLYLPVDITVGNWIRQLARSTQSLALGGELSTEFPVMLADLEEIIYGTTPEVSNFIQKLESIRIEKLPKLGHLWKSQNQNVSLGNLKFISIFGCPNLCYLFSVTTARSLVQLECLAIEDCDKIEQVFWNGMESNTDASIIELPNLQELRLSELPNLVAFSQGVEIIESLHQLTRLTIKDCPKLRTKIGKCPNLISVNFSGSQHLPCSRHTIQELHISNCDTIKEILWDEIKDEGERHIIFPELMELALRDLPCFTTFFRGVESIEFPKLEWMTISKLPRLKSLLPWDLEASTHDHRSPYLFCNAKNVSMGNLKSIFIWRCANLCHLFSAATRRSLVQLERLEIEDCVKIEQVFWNEMESNTDACIIEFPKLQELRLSKLPNLAAFSQGVEIIESLHQLTRLTIKGCPKLRTKIGKCPNLRFVNFSNFSGSQHLHCSRHTIQELIISDCDTIEELILWDEIKDEGERHIIFPELMELALLDLPCITTFCRGVESIMFPELEQMTIGNLPRLNSVLPLDLDATHDHDSLHFFCNPKVEFPRLEELHLFELPDTISKIWCRHVPINFFQNLEKLYIVNVNGIGNLISSSIAENLVNLKYLSIERCQEIVDVIEDEKEAFTMTPFRNLEVLSIETLHKLRSFCQWKHALELPSLKEVEIVDCPGMETFTLGSLSTPYLSRFSIDNKKVETKDLNGGIRDHFRIKIEDDDENKDEDDQYEKFLLEYIKEEVEDAKKVESSWSKFL